MKTRAQAKLDGDKYYFTGKECKHGHISIRRVTTGNCVDCDMLRKEKGLRTKEFSERKRKRTPHEIKLYIIRNHGLPVATIARRVNRNVFAVYDALEALNIPRSGKPENYVG